MEGAPVISLVLARMHTQLRARSHSVIHDVIKAVRGITVTERVAALARARAQEFVNRNRISRGSRKCTRVHARVVPCGEEREGRKKRERGRERKEKFRDQTVLRRLSRAFRFCSQLEVAERLARPIAGHGNIQFQFEPCPHAPRVINCKKTRRSTLRCEGGAIIRKCWSGTTALSLPRLAERYAAVSRMQCACASRVPIRKS